MNPLNEVTTETSAESVLPFVFDPIDLAEAEERVVGIKTERDQTLLEIENLETEIWALLGKGEIRP